MLSLCFTVIVPTNMTLDSLMYVTSCPGFSPTPRSVVANKEELWKRGCAVRTSSQLCYAPAIQWSKEGLRSNCGDIEGLGDHETIRGQWAANKKRTLENWLGQIVVINNNKMDRLFYSLKLIFIISTFVPEKLLGLAKATIWKKGKLLHKWHQLQDFE